MKANVTSAFSVAVLALATGIPGVRISAAPDPQVKSGVERLYVIDCGDGSGPDESRWTPGVNVGTPVGFPGHCYLIHYSQGWFLWDTGIDDAVAQLPNHEEVFHEWGPGTISANLRGQKQDSFFFLPNDADALAPCRIVRRSNAEARQTAQVAQLPPVVRVSVVRSRKSEPEDRSE